ncbi:MAG: hypothetical protein ACXVNM_09240 [Bacteroidia bacterium]
MKKLKVINVLFVVIILTIVSCRRPAFDKNKYGNCSDGITNQNETDVDCGGPCVPCANCDNGIKDGAETGIDCGPNCVSCTPPCSIAASTSNYTLYPSGFTSSVSSSSSVNYATYYSSQDEIDVTLSGGYISSIKIALCPGFNPISYIPLNQTMVFKTVDYSSFSINNKNEVTVYYSGNFGFSGIYGAADAGELVYMTKINSTTLRIQFCNIKAYNERLSLNCTAN